ncbi:MAG: orotidine-5'-phosphate decarboxylase [Desulfovibrio sp.]
MSELVVALDFPDATAAVVMAERLRGVAPWVKVGLELFTAEGPGVVEKLKKLDFRVFLDLKFFDIPNTVRGAVRSAGRAGADMCNIHVLGGARMAEAALAGRAESRPEMLLFGVTLLTSMTEADLPLETCGIKGPELAQRLAVSAKAYYLDGVVCSGLEVAGIKAATAGGLFCLTPGIRPGGAERSDQRRVVTPAEAVRSGADYLVVGRPITGSAHPDRAAEAIQIEMHRAAREI